MGIAAEDALPGRCGEDADDSGLLVCERREAAAPRWILWAVAGVALATNCLSLSGSHLWIRPDSIEYIQLAAGIAERFDLSNDLFLIRPPGYPLLLAALFWAFGSSSPAAILVVQHAMAIATAVLTASIGWHLTSRKSIALIAGLLCACSLRMLAYTNVVQAESAFTLTLMCSVYFMIRYSQTGVWRLLALASLWAGLSYLFRPIGLHLLGVCAVAVLIRAWRGVPSGVATGGVGICDGQGAAVGSRSKSGGAGKRLGPEFLRVCLIGSVITVVPALAVAAPWMIKNAVLHDSLQTARSLDYVLYIRTVGLDRLDSETSESLADIREVVALARMNGDRSGPDDFRAEGTVVKAYQRVRGEPFAVSSAIMGQAAWDLMLEHPGAIALRTFKYAAWMVLAPDAAYRFQPGGTPGINGKRAKNAEIYDIATHAVGLGSWENVLNDYRHYIPLRADTRAATPLWTAITRWFYRHVDRAPPLFGPGETVYEQLVGLCVLGGLLSLLGRGREPWLLVALVISLQVFLSAFLSGPQTRYAVPIVPLVLLYASSLMVTVVRVSWTAVRSRRIWWSRDVAGQSPGFGASAGF